LSNLLTSITNVMIVGICTIELFLPDNGSLKDKRQVLKSLKDRVKQRFNVSIAEVGGQDTWQVAVLGLAAVSEEAQEARMRLEKAIDFIEDLHLAVVTDQEVEIL